MKRVIVAFAVLVACDGAERREAESLVNAEQRYRQADTSENKAQMTDALRAVPCTAPDVCRARDACLASAEATTKALRLKHEVEIGLAALEKGTLAKESPEAQALPEKLDEAETLLKEGFRGLPACDDQLAALKRKHHI